MLEVLVLLGTTLAGAGGAVGVVPLLRPESKRREALAVRAYVRDWGYSGKPRFPISSRPPTVAPGLLYAAGVGFLPGNFKADPRFPGDQAISHRIGRPEDVDAIGWKAAGGLRATDTRLASAAILLIAVSVLVTAAGLLGG